MFCYNCGRQLSEHDFCTACGADVSTYKKIMQISNMYYNEGLERANVRDLSGAIVSLRQSLKFNKNHVEARNLLGLVYYETGEVVAALSEWVISKNLRPEKNIADDYINRLQSNTSRLDSINQTIKKYNQALVLCAQGSEDYAAIQLKKVLSLNPKFMRAHQLLALIYIHKEEWERAEKELNKCLEIDRNNTVTLRYMKEVRDMTAPDEGVKAGKPKKEGALRYQSDNEIIIQPLNPKEQRKASVTALINMGIGLLVGLAVMYFLVMPAAKTNARNEAQQTIKKITEESDEKTLTIKKLEDELKSLQSQSGSWEQKLTGYVGTDGTLQTLDNLIKAATEYLANKDAKTAAESLDVIVANLKVEDMNETFKGLYEALCNLVGPEVAGDYYTRGYEQYRTDNFAGAIPILERATQYGVGLPAKERVDAYFYLAQAYLKNDNKEEAVAAFNKVIELFPNTERADSAKKILADMQ
ncbi:MAG: tetratricopeptide repeat protein [Lachnospiraceae bacterium]|nr:tetratricopeptide repeat protein [Lachnospiraceae bacterium]